MKLFIIIALQLFSLCVFAAGTLVQTSPLNYNLIKSTVNGTVQFDDASAPGAQYIPPGSTVNLAGDYIWIKITNIKGTADSPITFINVGQVRIGGFFSYNAVMQGKYFKILGNGDSVAHPYGMLFMGVNDTTWSANGINLGNSSDVEISHLEFYKLESGIQTNPTSGFREYNMNIHHNYMHNIGTLKLNGGRSEGIYAGNTHNFSDSVILVNCHIEYNIFDTIQGNAIQVNGGEYFIQYNTIRRTGLSLLYGQISAIQVGGHNRVLINGNTIDSAHGKLMDVYGTGAFGLSGPDSLIVTNNAFTNSDVRPANTTEDLFYFNVKDSGMLSMRWQNNTITNCSARYGFNNATLTGTTNGSIFIDNIVTGGTFTAAVKSLNALDTWIITDPLTVYADAGKDQAITGDSTFLIGSSSGAGTISYYQWSQISGASVTIRSSASPYTSVAGLSIGRYVFRLSVHGISNTATSDVTIDVFPYKSSNQFQRGHPLKVIQQ